METVLTLMKILVPLAYAGALYLYGRLFFSMNEKRLAPLASQGLVAALGLHTALLTLIGLFYDRCPLGTWGEGLLFCAWILVAIHFVSEWIADTRRLGFFMLLPITLLVGVSVLLLRNSIVLPEKYQSSWFTFHIVASLASYAGYCMASVLAVLYLILHSKLKRKRFDITFRKLPSLEKLDKLAASWSILGSITMAIASTIGFFWVYHAALEGMQPRDLTIFVAFLIYVLAGLARLLPGFRGRHHAAVLLVGFCVLVFSNLLQTHGFEA